MSIERQFSTSPLRPKHLPAMGDSAIPRGIDMIIKAIEQAGHLRNRIVYENRRRSAPSASMSVLPPANAVILPIHCRWSGSIFLCLVLLRIFTRPNFPS